ncbi:SRPBCC family protein [Nonomuraea sp. NPDC050536]|uniref:SRPBCC family protein n=1 Tax=Nonomuraea sp. NPDC050536 TaxID=3364366 RepID=UPI0037C7F0BB
MSTRHRLTGEIVVPLPPEEAFALFTPRGEGAWAAGWKPRFPHETPDDSEPGTVFETDAHGEVTTWVVLEREPGRRISYARLTPGSRAGTVSVLLKPEGKVEVTYDLTALSEHGEHALDRFAAGYADYLSSWEQAIKKGTPSPSAPPSAA